MSEVIDFAKILRRILMERVQPNYGCDNNHATALDAAITEYESTKRAEYERANPLGGPAKMFDAIAERIRAGEEYDEVLRDYGVTVESRGREHAAGVTAPGGGTEPPAAPSAPFDREAAAERAWVAWHSRSPVRETVTWAKVAPAYQAEFRRVVDAVLNVPQGFATDNARPDHADNSVTVGAPSPSLDYPTVTLNGVEYVPRHALAASQAELSDRTATCKIVERHWHEAQAELREANRQFDALAEQAKGYLAECERLRGEIESEQHELDMVMVKYGVPVPGCTVPYRENEMVQKEDARTCVRRAVSAVANVLLDQRDAAVQRAEAAERERDDLAKKFVDMKAYADAAESQVARLREALTDEECESLVTAWFSLSHTGPGGGAFWDRVRAVIAKFFELREVKS